MNKTMIVPLLLDAITSYLQEVMVDAVALNDPTRVDQVKIGRYQQNPSVAFQRLAVLHGDIDDPAYLDGIAPRITRNHPLAFEVEPREIGGTQLWYRRGIVYAELFFLNQGITESESRLLAYEILGRVQNHIESVPISGLVDDFGERASLMLSTASNMIQTGGPPQSWIFRGKVYWDCLTVREPILELQTF